MKKVRITVLKTTLDKELAAEYGADVVPTFVTFRDGEVYSIMQGVIDEKIFAERIKELL